ncbi:MFS transporter [Chloroflexota bacterium]
MFYGWWILALVFLSSSFYSAVVLYGFTAYFSPLNAEFGWSYTAISVVASIRGLESGLVDFIIGFALDRFGGRRIASIGCFVIGVGFLMLSRVNSLGMFYLLFIIIFIGSSSLGSVFVAHIVAQWFQKKFGLVYGIVVAGFGAGGSAVPGIVHLLDNLGWRNTFIIFGVSALILSSVLAVFLRNKPEDIGSLPDGLSEDKLQDTNADLNGINTASHRLKSDYSAREAISTLPFWILAYVGAAVSFSVLMVITHVMPYLEQMGYTRNMAGFVAMMIPVLSVVGRIGLGWVSDFVSVKTVIILGLICQAIGILLFFNANLTILLIPFIVLFGIAFGGNRVIQMKILREYYGKAWIGSIAGLQIGTSAILGLGGPLLAGYVFDNYNSYSIAWVVNIVLLMIGLPLLLVIKNPQTK